MFKLYSIIDNGYLFDDYVKSMYEKNDYYSINNFSKYNNRNQVDFKLLDGPPFISGYDSKISNLHAGHCLISYLKSAFDIYNFMNEKNVDFTTSSDNHGLPTELLICKHLNLQDTRNIKDIGLDVFNSTGLKIIDQSEENWKIIYQKLGRDYSPNHYRTSQIEYMDKVWETLYHLWSKDYLYQGVKVLPYSYKLETPLSNFEANENYKTIETKTYYFKVEFKPNHYFIFWTTTLWTIPFNVCLCLNPDGEYYSINVDNENEKKVYIIEKHYVNHFLKLTGIKEKGEFYDYGYNLVNIEYKPIFKAFEYCGIYRTLVDHYVNLNISTSSQTEQQKFIGSGIVHLSPAFGEEDYRVCKRIIKESDIFKFCLIDDKCNFNKIVGLEEIEGKNIFDPFVTEYLESKFKDSIVATETITHNYPFSPRTDEPIVYKVCKSYFIKVKENKNLLIEQNKKINWKPKYIQNGRFGQWIENAEDWCISRNRFFGTPLNIWVNVKDENDYFVVKNIKHLEKLTGKKFNDIHPQYIFDLPIYLKDQKYINVNLTFDCWFESGCSCLIKFNRNNKIKGNGKIKNKEIDDDFLPYDLCIEGIDQCRGYFYTSLIISTLLYDQPPFMNCICTGLIQDEKGKKLSKSSGNYKPPEEYIKSFGSDAFRLYLLGSVLSNGENLKFDEGEIKHYKQKLIQFINCIRFLNDYNILYYGKEINFNKSFNSEIIVIQKKIIEGNDDSDELSLDTLDLWMLAELDLLTYKINKNFKNLEIKQSVELLLSFIEKFTNIYVKFSRDRIKTGQIGAFLSFKTIIRKLIFLLTPFTPFLSEYLFNLNVDKPESIKLLTYPKPNIGENDIEPAFYIDSDIINVEKFVNILQNIRTLRNNDKENKDSYANRLIIKSFYNLDFLKSFEEIIKKELKILNIEYLNIEASDFSIKYNYQSIGKKCKEIAKAIKGHKFSITEIKKYLNHEIKYLDFEFNGQIYKIDKSLIDSIKPIYENEKDYNGYIFYFDTTKTKEVEERNIIKSLIDKIQDKRKKKGFKVYENIIIYVEDNSTNLQIYLDNIDFIHNSIVNKNIIFLTNNRQQKVQIKRLKMNT